MKDIIRELLSKASEEMNLDLANIASDLMNKLATTTDLPWGWNSVDKELYEEFKNDDWLVNSVYEFEVMKEEEESDMNGLADRTVNLRGVLPKISRICLYKNNGKGRAVIPISFNLEQLDDYVYKVDLRPKVEKTFYDISGSTGAMSKNHVEFTRTPDKKLELIGLFLDLYYPKEYAGKYPIPVTEKEAEELLRKADAASQYQFGCSLIEAMERKVKGEMML